MKILHTADLHLGKFIYEKSLIEDQKYILDILFNILSNNSFDALLISGDVYDKTIPSQEAVSLFGAFLGSLKHKCPDISIFIIPGNHDSSERLGFGNSLFQKLGVYIAREIEEALNPIIIKETAFFLVPFVSAETLVSIADDLENARQRALQNGAKHSVVLAHVFSSGALKSESERTFLGSAEKISGGFFSAFDYAALGHLHRYQKAGENAWYSGSPLSFSFDEAGSVNEEPHKKYFLQIELNDACPAVIKPIEINPLKIMRRLKGSFDYFFKKDAAELKGVENDYLEINLSGEELVTQPAALLGQIYPNILSITQSEAFAAFSQERDNAVSSLRGHGGEDITLDFCAFLKDLYGERNNENCEALTQKETLFRELQKEIEAEEAENKTGKTYNS